MNWQMGRRRAAPAVQVAPAVVIGSPVQAACSKCKAMTPHVILAKIGVKPTRVECVTCKDAHVFKPALVRRSPITAGMSPQEAWAASMRHARGESTPYSASGRYAVGSRVSHPSFGDGVVAKLTSTTVCEVLLLGAHSQAHHGQRAARGAASGEIASARSPDAPARVGRASACAIPDSTRGPVPSPRRAEPDGATLPCSLRSAARCARGGSTRGACLGRSGRAPRAAQRCCNASASSLTAFTESRS